MPNETPSNLEQLQKIQTLLLQQQQIQAQYDQIVATIKANPPQDETTIANIKKQLQSLNTNYLQIQAQLQALGYQAPNTTNKPAEIKS